jgi:hypothetical protein
MAALDPTAEPETDGQGNVPSIPRSTLKIIKATGDSGDDDEDYLESLLGGGDDDEEEESDEDDEEVNGGPSDPSKSKKARREAAIKKLLEATKEESDDEMKDADAKPNGAKSNKGKGKASDEDDEESDEEGDALDYTTEDYVVCTLDTERVRTPFGPRLTRPQLHATDPSHRIISNPSTSRLAREKRCFSALREHIRSISLAIMSYPMARTSPTRTRRMMMTNTISIPGLMTWPMRILTR